MSIVQGDFRLVSIFVATRNTRKKYALVFIDDVKVKAEYTCYVRCVETLFAVDSQEIKRCYAGIKRKDKDRWLRYFLGVAFPSKWFARLNEEESFNLWNSAKARNVPFFPSRYADDGMYEPVSDDGYC